MRRFKFLSNLDQRSESAYKNIFGSVALKGVSMVVSLLLVPMTMEYVSPERYGIWLTLSSIVGWLSFFDIGLSNGAKNKITESRARNDNDSAKKYVSTSYISIAFIFILVFLFYLLINRWLDWSSIMAVDRGLNSELSVVMTIVVGLFCLTMVLSVINSVVSALQKPALSSLITTIGQVAVLGAISFLVFTTSEKGTGSLRSLALCLLGIPCVVSLLFSIFLFLGRYRTLSPSVYSFRMPLVSDILSLGWKFFVIQGSFILIFQVSNIIIIREVDPISVTQYNIAYRYFMVSHMIYNIILTPFWAAFTDAYVKKDTDWMKLTYKRLSNCWIFFTFGVLLMLVLSPFLYKIWIGDQVTIPFVLSVFMSVFVAVNSRAGLYMTLINGTGNVFVQMWTYLVFGLLSVPFMIVAARLWGLIGVVLVLTFSVLTLSIVGHIQLKKLLNGVASGIWVK